MTDAAASQDLTVLSAYKDPIYDMVIVTVMRQLVTADPTDVAFNATGPTSCIASWGLVDSAGTIQYHGPSNHTYLTLDVYDRSVVPPTAVSVRSALPGWSDLPVYAVSGSGPVYLQWRPLLAGESSVTLRFVFPLSIGFMGFGIRK